MRTALSKPNVPLRIGSLVDPRWAWVHKALRFCAPLTEGRGSATLDFAGRKLGTFENSAGWQTTEFGPALMMTNVTNQRVSFSTDPLPNGPPRLTIACVVNLDAFGGDDRIFSGIFSGSSSSFAFRQQSGTPDFFLVNTGATLVSASGGALATGRTHALVGVLRAGNLMEFWLDGKLVGTNTFSGTVRSTASVHIGNGGGGGFAIDGWIGLALIALRDWSPGEIKAWSSNPMAFLQPRVPVSRWVQTDQVVYPVATPSAGNWTAVGEATLHAAMGEGAVVDDADYALSPDNPVAEAAKVTMGDLATPKAGDITLSYRIRRNA